MDLITFQKLPNRRKLALVFRFVMLGLVVLLATPFLAQQAAAPTVIGVVDDWSHHHLVFSNPGTLVDAMRTGMVETWHKVVNDPRYQMQQRRRSLSQRPVAAVPDLAAPTATSSALRENPDAASKKKQPLKKDWSTNLGAAASLIGAVGTLSGGISGSSTLVVDGVTFHASPPAAATATGTFTGNPTSGQTVTIGGSEVLTASVSAQASSTGTFTANPTNGQTVKISNGANSETLTSSLSTAATGTITVGSGFCIATGQGVTINGTALTTNATQGTGSVAINSTPSNNDTVTVGSTTYTLVTSTFPGTNQVHISGTSTTATNLQQAINGTCTLFQCGTGTAANTSATAGAPSSGTVPLTALCADNSQVTVSTTSSHVTANNVAAGAPGSNTTTTFALNASGTTPASNTVTATNIATTVGANATTSAIVTATSAGGTVTLTAKTVGTVGNGYTLAQNAASGVSVSGATLSGGVSGTNTGTSFAVDGVLADDAANLVAAINRNNTNVGVTASSPSSAQVTITANTGGTAGNSITVTNGLTGIPLPNLSGGTDGTNTGTSFAIDNVNDAANLASAITRNGGTVGVTAAAVGAVVTVTASTAGTGGNSIALAKSLSNFAWSPTSALAGGTDGTTSGTSNPPTFAYWSVNNYVSSAQVASNIASATNANSTVSAVLTAAPNTPASGDVTFTAKALGTSGNGIAVTPAGFSAFTGGSLSGGAMGTVQPNAFPAKFSFSITTASCSTDFVVYPTGVPGGTGGANIIAYNNLYAGGCTGTVPSVYWAYNTGGTVTTSPTISFDGTQVAFIQVSGTTASLVLLKWAASATESLTAPDTLTVQSSASAYRSCTAPCFYTFSLGANDTFSSPYYDYGNDAMYVGDDAGKLHRITGVFSGTSIVEASGFPVTLNSSYKVSSPVYDANSYVFVADTGGFLYSVTTSGIIHGTTGRLGTVGDVIDAPLVDGSVGSVHVFVTTSAVIPSGTCYSSTLSNVVFELSTSFTTTYGGCVYVGVGGTGYYLYDGNFDNVYYQSSNHTGHLYVVGDTGAVTGATLYQVVISGGYFTGTVNTAVSSLTYGGSGSEHPWPSPITEFCNGACTVSGGVTNSGTDYLFFSVNRGNKSGCTTAAGNGCILAYNVSNPAPASITEAGTGLNVITPGTNGCWATSGLAIDNSVNALAGASQIYFVNLNGNAAGNPTAQTSSNCTAGTTATIAAVQAAQASP